MTSELFFEIGTEELPASYIRPALEQFQTLVTTALREGRIAFQGTRTWATPRRLGLLVEAVEAHGADSSQEILGPPTRIALGPDGSPQTPALKFMEKVGLPFEKLERKTTPKGEYLAATVLEKGVATATLFKDALPRLLGQIAFPKAMRWGTGRTTFARPIRWLVALYNGDVIPFSFAGITSGRTSCGHRFLAPEPFEITTFAAYEAEARKRYVILDPAERAAIIRTQGAALTASVGGMIVEDEELVEINTFLVEYPVPILASFEPENLELPPELLRTSMRHHLKCFVVSDPQGKLLPYFVPISALPSRDPATVLHGYQRVLRARLSDARFFYNEDRKQPLSDKVVRLDGVMFQAKLGSYGDKVRRLQAQVPQITDALGWQDAKEKAERAAFLCKADLVSGMVFEFPELQGIMGRYYALYHGEDPEVAQAILEHYLPAGADDPLPSSNVALSLALAERFDLLLGGWAVGLKPTGSADPYGLRRQAIGLLRILKEKALPVSLQTLLSIAAKPLHDKLAANKLVTGEVYEYLCGRLQALFEKEGWPRDAVDAVCVLDLVIRHPLSRLETLLQNLKDALKSGILAGLAYSFKRVNNILRAADKKGVTSAYPGLGALFYRESSPALRLDAFKEEAEIALLYAYQDVEATVTKAIAEGDFGVALEKLLRLRGPIDDLFDKVMVMDNDPDVRDRRLSLLRGIARLAFLDFARIHTEDQA